MALTYEEFDASDVALSGDHRLSGIRKEGYMYRKQILANVEHQWSVGVVVSSEAGVDFEGKKVVKAGTPITGDLDDRTTAFTQASDTATGVLLHDVDVTDGNNNGTMLVFGFVNTNRLDDDVKELITENVKSSLNMIKFLAC